MPLAEMCPRPQRSASRSNLMAGLKVASVAGEFEETGRRPPANLLLAPIPMLLGRVAAVDCSSGAAAEKWACGSGRSGSCSTHATAHGARRLAAPEVSADPPEAPRHRRAGSRVSPALAWAEEQGEGRAKAPQGVSQTPEACGSGSRPRRFRSSTSLGEQSVTSSLSVVACSTGTCCSRVSLAQVPGQEGILSGVWRKGANIGHGSYGQVFKALDTRTGQIFAVKEARVDGADHDDCTFVEKLKSELKICRALRHPHIVSYLGHEEEDGCLRIFLEFVSGGSMSKLLGEFGALTGSLLQGSVQQALDGLHYLHTQKPPVVHRDIKCANLLVDTKFRVKLADFGCSKRSEMTQSFTMVGSIPWMAPEVFKEGHGRKADVWSLGCTVLEMATAEHPWGTGAFDNIMNAVWTISMTTELPAIPEALPSSCRDFISTCIRRSVEERPSSRRLREHDFVAAAVAAA